MHAMRLQQLCMNQFQKSGSRNDGSPIFLRFGYPVTQTYELIAQIHQFISCWLQWTNNVVWTNATIITLQAKGLTKTLEPKLVPNLLPTRFDVNKRCSYHQGPSHDKIMCFNLRHTIQDLIDNMVITPPIRPNVANNPSLNHNMSRWPQINYFAFRGKREERSD